MRDSRRQIPHDELGVSSARRFGPTSPVARRFRRVPHPHGGRGHIGVLTAGGRVRIRRAPGARSPEGEHGGPDPDTTAAGASRVSKAVETIALARAERQDALERAPVVSDPGLRVSRYDGNGNAPVRSGNFGRADLKRQVARPGAIWPRRRVRLDETTPEKVRVEHQEVREEIGEMVVKKKRLAVVD